MDVLDHMPLVKKVARRYRGPVPYEDLVQEGYVALREAVEHYDPRRAAFSTYACRVLSERFRVLQYEGGTVRQPKWTAKALHKYFLTGVSMAHEQGRFPSVEEVAERTGDDPAVIRKLVSAWCLGRTNADETTHALHRSVRYDHLWEHVRSRWPQLTELEQDLVNEAFGLDRQPRSSMYMAISRRMTRADVECTVKRALEKLKEGL